MQNLILCFGEILYDLFPSYRRMGGAPFNFAYHMYSLGFPAKMISRVGDDDDGREILDFLNKGLGSELIQRDTIHATGKVLVQLDKKGIPDFTIVEDTAYDYIEFDEAVDKAVRQEPAMIYYGTLSQRNGTSRSTLEKILGRNSSAWGLYDMNLRQDCFTKEIVEQSLKNCNIVKLNHDELKQCKSLFDNTEEDQAFVQTLMERYDIEWLCLTRGEGGSELFGPPGHFIKPSVPKQSIVDTVGAGDAYTAILALGALKHWDPDTILDRATSFAGAVCSLKGAIPEDPAFYDTYLPWAKEEGNGR